MIIKKRGEFKRVVNYNGSVEPKRLTFIRDDK